MPPKKDINYIFVKGFLKKTKKVNYILFPHKKLTNYLALDAQKDYGGDSAKI